MMLCSSVTVGVHDAQKDLVCLYPIVRKNENRCRAPDFARIIMKTYPKRSTVMGGEEGGVCIGPAMLEMARGFEPQ
jgi:hypothetical protein